MPFIQCDIHRGRSDVQRKELRDRITNAVRRITGAPTAPQRSKPEFVMIKIVLTAAISLVAASSAFCAEDLSTARAPLPPGAFTTSAQSDEWKIENALAAAPASIADRATVIDWPSNPKDGLSHGRVLRQGRNGWTCMPDVPGRPQHNPMCADETLMKWFAATLAGEKPSIDRVGLAYMLLGEARQGQNAAPAKDPTQVKEWFYIGPHVMVVLPDSDQEALRGINQDLSNNEPYVSVLNSAPGSTPIWVIPVAQSGARIKEEPAK
jgi:hypothetical protein